MRPASSSSNAFRHHTDTIRHGVDTSLLSGRAVMVPMAKEHLHLEGMAAGCACIASDVVGVREAIDHERTGLLVPESDAIALAAALQRMLTHPAEAGAMAQAARQHAETNFDVSIMQHRYAQLLHAVDENRTFIST